MARDDAELDDTELMARVTTVARHVLGLPEDIRLDTGTDLSAVVYLDSMRLMAFVVGLESEFGVEFAVDDLSGETVTDLGKLVQLLRRRVGAVGQEG